jgi:hypothetical protein
MRQESSEDVVVGGKDFQIEVYVTDDGLNRVVRISRNGKPVGPGYTLPVKKEREIEKQHLVDAIEEVIKAAKQSLASLPAEELEKL